MTSPLPELPTRHLGLGATSFPFDKAALGVITRILPLKRKHKLILNWQIPSQLRKYRCVVVTVAIVCSSTILASSPTQLQEPCALLFSFFLVVASMLEISHCEDARSLLEVTVGIRNTQSHS